MKAFKILIAVFLITTQYATAQSVIFIDVNADYSGLPTCSDGAVYKNFTDAVNGLNSSSLPENYFPITFKVTAGQTFYEPTAIPPIKKSGLSETANIVFEKSGEGDNPVIVPARGRGNEDYGIHILGKGYITFNGIDIQQDNYDGRVYSNASGIEFGYFITNEGEKGANSNRIINCRVILNNKNSRTIGIYQKNSSDYTISQSNNIHNNYINDEVYNCYRGIVISGNTNPEAQSYEKGCKISNCKVGSPEMGGIGAVTGGKGDVYGIYINKQSGFTIANCEIQQVNYYSLTDAGSSFGVLCTNITGTNILNANRIHGVYNSGIGSAQSGACGLSVIGKESAILSITNHFISNIFNSTEAPSSSVLTSGIKIDGGGDVSIYHNSVYLSYGTSNAQSPSANLEIVKTATATLHVKNNIFKNYYHSSVAKTYCFYLPGGILTDAGSNIYDCHPGTTYYTGFYNNASLQTIAQWQAAVTADVNSKQFGVEFVSENDLRLARAGITDANKSHGFVDCIDCILDIQFASRSLARPYIGASERPLDEGCLDSYIVYTPNCDILSAPNVGECNFIKNCDFDLTTAYNDDCSTNDYSNNLIAFNRGNVRDWYAPQGTPVHNSYYSGLLCGASTLVGNNFVGLNATISRLERFGQGLSVNNSAIAQHIPALVPGNKYSFSIFIAPVYQEGAVAPPWLNNSYNCNFDVVLFNCNDQASIYTVPAPFTGSGTETTSPSPAIVSNSQKIICDKVFPTAAPQDHYGQWDGFECFLPYPWRQIVVSFTAGNAYDMVWIYPHFDKNMEDENASIQTELLVAYPELIETTNFTAGPKPNTNTYPTCLINIGPATPNCAPAFAEFSWVDPQGILHSITNPNQQLQVDASNPANVGIWKLIMKPSTQYENPSPLQNLNICSQILDVFTTVTVDACSPPCIKLPKLP